MVGVDQVWLCAAGIRRDGDTDDFYTSFMRDVGRAGPQLWLPSAEDHLAGKIDEKILALDAWKLQVHCSTAALLAEALDSPGTSFTVKFPAPARSKIGTAIGEFELSCVSVDIDGTELWEAFLVAKVLDLSQIRAVDVAAQIARAAIQRDAEDWRSTTYTHDAYAFSALVDLACAEDALELSETGNLPERSAPSDLRLGVHAHYARKHGLVDAQVEGSAVLSLCGYWFVPTADHVDLATCSECSNRHDQMVVR